MRLACRTPEPSSRASRSRTGKWSLRWRDVGALEAGVAFESFGWSRFRRGLGSGNAEQDVSSRARTRLNLEGPPEPPASCGHALDAHAEARLRLGLEA